MSCVTAMRPILLPQRWQAAEKISSWKNWRRGRDSNPRYGCPYAAFRVRCIQPLCHLSGARLGVERVYLSNAARANKGVGISAVSSAEFFGNGPNRARIGQRRTLLRAGEARPPDDLAPDRDFGL